LRRLDRMAAILDGAAGGDSPAASAMRASLAATGVSAEHCHDVLRAFRLDAVKLRYRDWDDLMGYCRYSAAPVGRQLLDLHGESRATWPASDALCAALQVLNHLQDCAADYRALDRVYLPIADLEAAGCTVDALAAPAASAGLRRAIDPLLDRTEALIAAARDLPPRVAARGHWPKGRSGRDLVLLGDAAAADRPTQRHVRDLRLLPRGRRYRRRHRPAGAEAGRARRLARRDRRALRRQAETSRRPRAAW